MIIGFAWLILMSESAGIPGLLQWVGLWDNARSFYPSFWSIRIGLVVLGFSIVSLILFPSVTLTILIYFLGVFVMPTMLGRPQDWTMTSNISDKALGDANLPLGAALAVVMLLVHVAVLTLSALLARRREA